MRSKLLGCLWCRRMDPQRLTWWDRCLWSGVPVRSRWVFVVSEERSAERSVDVLRRSVDVLRNVLWTFCVVPWTFCAVLMSQRQLSCESLQIGSQSPVLVQNRSLVRGTSDRPVCLSVAHGERLSAFWLTRNFSISGSPVERGFALLVGAIPVGILREPHRNAMPCYALDTEMTGASELPNSVLVPVCCFLFSGDDT